MKTLSGANWKEAFLGRRKERQSGPGSWPKAWIIASAAIWLLTGLPVQAQTYPSKPITFVVPFAAASATDQIARVLGQQLAGDLRGP